MRNGGRTEERKVDRENERMRWRKKEWEKEKGGKGSRRERQNERGVATFTVK